MSITMTSEHPQPIEKNVTTVEDFQIDINHADNELRIVLHDAATGKAMAHVFTSDGAYRFAQKVLRGYDQLEGL